MLTVCLASGLSEKDLILHFHRYFEAVLPRDIATILLSVNKVLRGKKIGSYYYCKYIIVCNYKNNVVTRILGIAVNGCDPGGKNGF